MDMVTLDLPGAQGTAWHKDMTMSPFAAGRGADNRFLTLRIPLEVPSRPGRGAVSYAHGSHSMWQLTEGARRPAALQALIRARSIPTSTPRRPGDASVWSGQTLHQVNPNDSPLRRSAIELMFIADGTPVLNSAYLLRLQHTEGHRADHLQSVGKLRWDAVWASKHRVGAPAVSSMTPLLHAAGCAVVTTAATGKALPSPGRTKTPTPVSTGTTRTAQSKKSLPMPSLTSLRGRG
jgi:ectoine hydroxylase-related dioxygenase (phytanoyl-CoA dioxygenase family)